MQCPGGTNWSLWSSHLGKIAEVFVACGFDVLTILDEVSEQFSTGKVRQQFSFALFDVGVDPAKVWLEVGVQGTVSVIRAFRGQLLEEMGVDGGLRQR